MKPVLTFFILSVLAGCMREVPDTNVPIETTLILGLGESLPPTRATDPDDLLITDWNVFVFNSFGNLEESVFLTRGEKQYTLSLLKDVPYTVMVAANMGYPLPIGSMDQARAFRYHMSYPDEYSHGLPMVAWLEDVTPKERIEVPLERLMARIDLSIDRRGLPADVLFKVVEVSVRGCPSSATLYPGSEAVDTFREGFTKRYFEVEDVNRTGGTVSLYVLENCSSGTSLRVEAEYHSDDYHTDPGERIPFDIPLGELVRNTVYPVVLKVNQ